MCGSVADDGAKLLGPQLAHFSTDFAPNSRATRNRIAKMRAFGWRAPKKACDFGAENCAGLCRILSAIAADEA